MLKKLIPGALALAFISPVAPVGAQRIGDRVGSPGQYESVPMDDAEFAARIKGAFAGQEDRRRVTADMPPTDYLSKKVVPLTAKEQKALALVKEFAARSADPFQGNAGKVVYMHGAAVPTIIGSPMNVCDVELQPGEVINEIIVGDAARWLVESGSSGSGTPHLLIKPVDAGLESSAVVTTNKRVYHLRLVSQRSGHTQYVGFAYPEDSMLRRVQAQKAEDKAREWGGIEGPDGQTLDLAKLNFAYRIRGKAAWKPSQVYDDGRQMFVKLSEKAKTGEIPALLVRKGDSDVLVNYRVKDQTMVVDGLFDRVLLIMGVGSDQEKVEVIRDGS